MSREKPVSKPLAKETKEDVIIAPVATENVEIEPIASRVTSVGNVATEEESPIPDTTPIVAEEHPIKTLSGDEKRIAPTFMPMSERDEVNMSKANLAPVSTGSSDLAPAVTAESGTNSVGAISGNAESIARRVFSAPVQNETSADPGSKSTEADAQHSTAMEVQKAADTTEDVREAPVVTANSASNPASAPALVTEAITTPEMISATTTTDIPSTMKHGAPVAARIAPTVSSSAPAARTETIVSGPSSTSKAKDSKGVSSWLKTKFSRRASKSAKPEIVTDNNEKGFVGGVNLTGAEAGNTMNSDIGNSSMREVAMAGKDRPHEPAPITDTAVVSPTTDDGLDEASPKAMGALRQSSSPSISSLSSDEDTRGRSAVPRDKEPLTAGEFVRSEVREGDHVEPKLAGPHVAAEAPNVHPTFTHSHEKPPSSSAGGGEEFEEARDTFDSEKLSPPATGVIIEERKSDSPARDSRFLEDL